MTFNENYASSPATLRFASVLMHSDSTAYTAHFVRPNFGFGKTSYMLETLYKIPTPLL